MLQHPLRRAPLWGHNWRHIMDWYTRTYKISGVQLFVVGTRVFRVTRVQFVVTTQTGSVQASVLHALDCPVETVALLFLCGPPLYPFERSDSFRVQLFLLLDEGNELTLFPRVDSRARHATHRRQRQEEPSGRQRQAGAIRLLFCPGMLFPQITSPFPGGRPPLPRKWQVPFHSLLNITIQRTFVRI